MLRSLMRNWLPSLVVPDLSVIHFHGLKACGMEAVVLDWDDTLSASNATWMPEEKPALHPLVKTAWDECVQVFGKDRIAILSNSAGSFRDLPSFQKAKEIESLLGVTVIRHGWMKPWTGSSVFTHLKTSAKKTCFIGDRLFTDVAFASRNGSPSIYCCVPLQDYDRLENKEPLLSLSTWRVAELNLLLRGLGISLALRQSLVKGEMTDDAAKQPPALLTYEDHGLHPQWIDKRDPLNASQIQSMERDLQALLHSVSQSMK